MEKYRMSIHQRLVNNGWRQGKVSRACAFYTKRDWIAVWFNYRGMLKFYRRLRVGIPPHKEVV